MTEGNLDWVRSWARLPRVSSKYSIFITSSWPSIMASVPGNTPLETGAPPHLQHGLTNRQLAEQSPDSTLSPSRAPQLPCAPQQFSPPSPHLCHPSLFCASSPAPHPGSGKAGPARPLLPAPLGWWSPGLRREQDSRQQAVSKAAHTVPGQTISGAPQWPCTSVPWDTMPHPRMALRTC